MSAIPMPTKSAAKPVVLDDETYAEIVESVVLSVPKNVFHSRENALLVAAFRRNELLAEQGLPARDQVEQSKVQTDLMTQMLATTRLQLEITQKQVNALEESAHATNAIEAHLKRFVELSEEPEVAAPEASGQAALLIVRFLTHVQSNVLDQDLENAKELNTNLAPLITGKCYSESLAYLRSLSSELAEDFIAVCRANFTDQQLHEQVRARLVHLVLLAQRIVWEIDDEGDVETLQTACARRSRKKAG